MASPVKALTLPQPWCYIGGCTRPRYARNWCRRHYNRWQRNGHPLGGNWKREGCSQPDCAEAHYGLDMCRKHYRRFKAHGSPDYAIATHAERLAFIDAAVEARGHDCILWPFPVDGSGYGRIQFDRRTTGAHAHTLTIAEGPRPPGMEAAHSCGVRHCVNPDHLRWATPADNQSDRVAHGTSNRGSGSGAAKLTEPDIPVIRLRRSRGEAIKEIAADYGVTATCISNVLSGRTWRHV